MHIRMTSRKPPVGGHSRPTQSLGQTVPAQGETQDAAPKTPHERDESTDSQALREASGSRMGQQAHDDLQQGQVDTDKGPQMDAVYDKIRGADEPNPKPRK